MMALLILFLLHLRIKHMTTRFPACKAHVFSSQLSCPLQKLKSERKTVSSQLYFFDRLHVSQCLSTKWPFPVPEFIVVQQRARVHVQKSHELRRQSRELGFLMVDIVLATWVIRTKIRDFRRNDFFLRSNCSLTRDAG